MAKIRGQIHDYGIVLGRKGRLSPNAASPRCGVVMLDQEDTVPTALLWRVARGEVTDADTNSTKAIITLPDRSLVRTVWLEVVTVFAGGTPSLLVGDGGNTDGFIETADITETSLGLYGISDLKVGAYLYDATSGAEERLMKYYATSDTIDVVVSASLTAGKAWIYVEYCVLDDLDPTL